MFRNTYTCAHCGQIFIRAGETTPVINRSDGETFHVTLFSGPTAGFYPDHVLCNFVYAHDRLGPQNDFLIVLVRHAEKDREGQLRQVEDVADKIAELVEAGEKLNAGYNFDNGQLTPGFAAPGREDDYKYFLAIRGSTC